MQSNTRSVWIGDTSTDGSTREFHGFIDNVRIYKKALSASEIKKHYAQQYPRYQFLVDKN